MFSWDNKYADTFTIYTYFHLKKDSLRTFDAYFELDNFLEQYCTQTLWLGFVRNHFINVTLQGIKRALIKVTQLKTQKSHMVNYKYPVMVPGLIILWIQ